MEKAKTRLRMIRRIRRGDGGDRGQETGDREQETGENSQFEPPRATEVHRGREMT